MVICHIYIKIYRVFR